MFLDEREKRFLERQGYSFTVRANGYGVHHTRVGFVAASHVAVKTRKTVNQIKLDSHYNLIAAMSRARDHFVSQNGDRSDTQHPPPWYVEAVRTAK
jgi:hypothetical protein